MRGACADQAHPGFVDLPPFDVLNFKPWYALEGDGPLCEDDCVIEDYDGLLDLSRTLAPGKNPVNMVDWKYSGFFLVRLDHRAHLLATKFLDPILAA